MGTVPRVLRIVGLVLVSLLAAASPVVLVAWAIGDFDPDWRFAAALAAVPLAPLLLVRLWRSALALKRPDDAGRGAVSDAWLATGIGALTLVAPLVVHEGNARAPGGILCVMAPAIIWLASISRRRGGGPVATAGIVLGTLDIVWILYWLLVLWAALHWF